MERDREQGVILTNAFRTGITLTAPFLGWTHVNMDIRETSHNTGAAHWVPLDQAIASGPQVWGLVSRWRRLLVSRSELTLYKKEHSYARMLVILYCSVAICLYLPRVPSIIPACSKTKS